MTYENIIVKSEAGVGHIQLNRPKALNALNGKLISELNLALDDFASDPTIGAVILTGNEKAFAAGADISEMKDLTFKEVTTTKFLHDWDHINQFPKPLIAAVSGFALGGGCEYALCCDFIIAADNAKFGLPEVTLGIIPGLGGTQRLARAIGKAKAMEMILTGRMMGAEEAERCGLVSRVVPLTELQNEAMAIAQKIAKLSQPVIKAAKAAVNQAFEADLNEGLGFERKSFHRMFDLADQKEGMAAFVEKRPAKFTNT